MEQFGRTTLHRLARSGDRVSKVEVLDRIANFATQISLNVTLRQITAIIDHAFGTERRNLSDHRRLQFCKAVETDSHAQCIGQGAQDRPILTRIAGREHRLVGELDSSFGIDVSARFLGKG